MLTMIRQRTSGGYAVPAHPADVIGFNGLAAGGRIAQEHRWTHHLFVADEGRAVAAAGRLEAAGWTVEQVAAQPDPFPGWAVRVFRDTVLDVAAMDAARDLFEVVAMEVGGSYAGWDTYPVPRHAAVG